MVSMVLDVKYLHILSCTHESADRQSASFDIFLYESDQQMSFYDIVWCCRWAQGWQLPLLIRFNLRQKIHFLCFFLQAKPWTSLTYETRSWKTWSTMSTSTTTCVYWMITAFTTHPRYRVRIEIKLHWVTSWLPSRWMGRSISWLRFHGTMRRLFFDSIAEVSIS